MADIPNSEKWTIEAETELRLKVSGSGYAFFKLLDGSAELLGIELEKGKEYALAPNRYTHIFSWKGAVILTWGGFDRIYQSKETLLPLYADLHTRLNALRADALKNKIPGPRVMLVGQSDSGKSTLCKTLAAYACRVGNTPIFVDCDVGQNDISVPGTIAATPLELKNFHVTEGFVGLRQLVYFMGFSALDKDAPLYHHYVHCLANNVKSVISKDPGLNASGIIVNTMGWVSGLGYTALVEIIKAFEIDVVVVVGDDGVLHDLKQTFSKMKFPSSSVVAPPNPDNDASSNSKDSEMVQPSSKTGKTKSVHLLRIPRSSGISERSVKYRSQTRNEVIRRYFYGPLPYTPDMKPYSPRLIDVSFTDVVIVRVLSRRNESHLVPINETSRLEPIRVRQEMPTKRLVNQLLAVSFSIADSTVSTYNVAGFVYVQDVDEEQKRIHLLKPNSNPLPGKYLLLGDQKWIK